MFNNNYFPNYDRGMFMPQSGQVIQTYQDPQPPVQCYFVSSERQMSNMQIQPNTVYIGINKDSKEIYMRKWNTDGNIEFESYKLSSGTQEESELKTIMAKLDDIEKRLKGTKDERNVTNVNAAGNGRQYAKQPTNANVQPNDGRKDAPTTD